MCEAEGTGGAVSPPVSTPKGPPPPQPQPGQDNADETDGHHRPIAKHSDGRRMVTNTAGEMHRLSHECSDLSRETAFLNRVLRLLRACERAGTRELVHGLADASRPHRTEHEQIERAVLFAPAAKCRRAGMCGGVSVHDICGDCATNDMRRAARGVAGHA